MKSLGKLQPLALLVLRTVLAIIFFFHGYPKLAHAQGGMQAFFSDHGLPGYFVYVSGILETFGAGLLLLGLFTRPVALLLTVEMAVAIWKVHSRSYFAVHEYEFPLAVAAACFLLATSGAGLVSVDHSLFEGGGGGGKSRAPRGAK